MLQLQAITKRYGNTTALQDVSLDIRAGEVHAVLGENGAGKSTLMKIAFGLVQPDAGVIKIDGQVTSLRSPADARAAGIGMVHQHFTSIDSLTVAENITLATAWPVRPSVMNARARELSERLGLPLEPTLLAGSLSTGLKQRLELLMALASDARLLLLDEPTSVLAPSEAVALLELIRDLRARGISVIFITHKLDEALAIADRMTVLRRGVVQVSAPREGLTRDQLIEAMVGTAGAAGYADITERQIATDGRSVVHAEALSVARVGETGAGLRSASFTLRAGELVGVAAVEGSGQRELFRAIAGLAAPSSGTLEVRGRVGFVPEDRTVEGTIQEFTLAENLALVLGDEAPWTHGPWIEWAGARARMGELVGLFDIRGATGSAMAALSGGNQQKVVVASALERRPAVLLAENPTRGLDIKASAAILGRLREAAGQGVAVLVHLPDLDELLPLVDRVVVLNNGTLTEMPAGAERQAIGAAMVT